MTTDLEPVFRAHWRRAVATVARLVGDLELAEDAVQDACAVALVQWPGPGTVQGFPPGQRNGRRRAGSGPAPR